MHLVTAGMLLFLAAAWPCLPCMPLNLCKPKNAQRSAVGRWFTKGILCGPDPFGGMVKEPLGSSLPLSITAVSQLAIYLRRPHMGSSTQLAAGPEGDDLNSSDDCQECQGPDGFWTAEAIMSFFKHLGRTHCAFFACLAASCVQPTTLHVLQAIAMTINASYHSGCWVQACGHACMLLELRVSDDFNI